jgi:hypothetical protein
LPTEEDIRINSFCVFQNAYVVIPNPYEKGDLVRIIGTDKIGKVNVSQEDWDKYVKKALSPESKEDWVDASITVIYSDDGHDHDHINPIFLEKVKDI